MHGARDAINEGNDNKKQQHVSEEWHDWCRLCASADMDNLDTYLKSGNGKYKKRRISIAIGKYFSIEIQQDGGSFSRLCAECFVLLTFLIDFHERVDKVQQMFIALQQKCSIAREEDTAALRYEFGVCKNELPAIEQMQWMLQRINASEAKGQEKKAKINDEDKQKREFEENVCSEQKAIPVAREEMLHAECDDNAFDIITKTREEVVCVFDENAEAEHVDDFVSEEKIKPFAMVHTECVAENGKAFDMIAKVEEEEEVCCAFDESAIGEHEDALASDAEFNNLSETSDETKTTKRKAIRKFSKKIRKNTSLSSGESTEYKYFCSNCKMHFQRIGNYRVHLKNKHGITDFIQSFACPTCSRSFKSEYFLNRHIKIHQPLADTELFPCPQCDRKFKAREYVATHIKLTHDRIRAYICEECGITLGTKDSLRQHMLTHTTDTPFVCEICTKSFKNHARLKQHLETHSSIKYTCGICGLQLNSRSSLTQHKLVHSDELRHKCDYCGRAFKRSKSLKGHLLLHSGIKPYACKVCEKPFTSSSNCRLHMKKLHPKEFMQLEAAGANKYTKGIPKLAVLKSVVKTGLDLIAITSKQSGNFASGKKNKAQKKGRTNTNSSKTRKPATTSSSIAESADPNAETEQIVQANIFV